VKEATNMAHSIIDICNARYYTPPREMYKPRALSDAHMHHCRRYPCQCVDGDIAAIDARLENGAIPDCRCPVTGETAIHVALRLVAEYSDRYVRTLIEAGASVNIACDYGVAPLTYIVTTQYHAAYISRRTDDYWTSIACKQISSAINMLLAAGAHVDGIESPRVVRSIRAGGPREELHRVRRKPVLSPPDMLETAVGVYARRSFPRSNIAVSALARRVILRALAAGCEAGATLRTCIPGPSAFSPLCQLVQACAFDAADILLACGWDLRTENLREFMIRADGDLWRHHTSAEKTAFIEYMERLFALRANPVSLQEECRRVVRGALKRTAGHTDVLPLVDQLPLPPPLKRYIRFDDIVI
jgi:hypothetical protein